MPVSEWLRTFSLLQGLISLAINLAVMVVLIEVVHQVASWLYRKVMNKVYALPLPIAYLVDVILHRLHKMRATHAGAP